MSGYRVEPSAATAWSDAQMDALFAEGFPPFITADLEVKRYIGRVREAFPHLDIMLVAGDGEPVATGWGVPIRWNGDADDLPSSFADVLRRAVELLDAERVADTFVICGGVVHPARKGTGAAAELVRSLIGLAASNGLGKVVAPLRPTRKHEHPRMEIDDYAARVREDGQPSDPWLRLHVRLGGRVIALAPQAQTMTGSVRQWEEWTGLSALADGDHVIPGGLSLLHVDLAADLGTYIEANIWVRHR